MKKLQFNSSLSEKRISEIKLIRLLLIWCLLISPILGDILITKDGNQIKGTYVTYKSKERKIIFQTDYGTEINFDLKVVEKVIDEKGNTLFDGIQESKRIKQQRNITCLTVAGLGALLIYIKLLEEVGGMWDKGDNR